MQSEKARIMNKILRTGLPKMTHYPVYKDGKVYKLCHPAMQLSGSCVAKKGRAAICRICRRIKEAEG